MNEAELSPQDEQRQKWEMGWLIRGFNGTLRKARRAKGLTQKQLADIVSCPVTTLSGVELLIRRPSPELRQNLADFLALDPQDVWPDWLEPRDKPIEAIGYQKMDQQTYSLLAPQVKQEVLSLEDHSQQPDQTISREMVRDRLESVMQSLTYREKEILKLRFGIGYDCAYTLEEVGRIFKINKERTRQIEQRALRKLKEEPRRRRLVGAAEEVFNTGACPSCQEFFTYARFCHRCRKQGCGACLERRTVEGRYVYLCGRCLDPASA